MWISEDSADSLQPHAPTERKNEQVNTMLLAFPLAFTFSEVENLPAAPLPVDWLLERPLPLLILLVSIGGVATMILASRAEGRRTLIAALVTLAVAGGVVAMP